MAKPCSIGSTFISSQTVNPEAAWNGRIVCVEVTERGFAFRREHPYYNGEVFVLGQQQLDQSFWVAASGPPPNLGTNLDRVMATLEEGGIQDRTRIVVFFINPNPLTGGLAPIDALRQGDVESVIEAAIDARY